MKTEINIYILFAILIIHWFADFITQTDWQAKNKSKSNEALTEHVLVYSLVWFGATALYCGIFENNQFTKMMYFAPITFAFHWVTDYITSRINSSLLNKGKTHLFFVSVGFDQVLHYVQLILTFSLLVK